MSPLRFATAVQKDSAGFTLIELILSIAVMAIVLIAMNAVFFTSLRLQEHTSAAVEEGLPIQQALATLRRDLQGAMPPASGGVLAGDFKAGSQGGVSSSGLGLPVDIEFNTTTGTLRDNEPWGEVQRVTYELKPSADRFAPGQELYRSVTRNLLATLPLPPEDQWLLSGVESVQFDCYDGSQWRNYWDTTLTETNLPVAVRVRVQLAARNANASMPEPIEMIVPINSQVRTNQAI